MKYKQENFVINIRSDESPIIITVPHGGMKNAYGSWLELFFKKRIKSEIPEENLIKKEKIVIGGDSQILHVMADILKGYSANAIIGLLPRVFVDYNRFVPEVAYADERIKSFYKAYHQAISETVKRVKNRWGVAVLFDFHGFGKQPIEGLEFDIILGTNAESCPGEMDKYFYNSLKDKYKIFCAGMDGLPIESNLYKGDTTNLFYHQKYGIDAMLIEIAPRFRSSNLEDSKMLGERLAQDLAGFFYELEKKIKVDL